LGRVAVVLTGDCGVTRLRSLRVLPRAERIAVVPLSSDTVAQIVWLLGEHQIQVAQWMPRGMQAAAARHLTEAHLQECCARSCGQARDWVAEHGVTDDARQATRLA
jgi:hypothetical protein